MNYWLGVIGAWILVDGIASLYTYTNGEKSRGQSWFKDHSFRIIRAGIGIILIVMGYFNALE